MSRVDLEEDLPVGIVLRSGELLVPGGARRRVEAPGGAVGDHDGVVAPLVELAVELAGALGGLEAVVGQVVHVHVELALLHLAALRDVPGEVVESLLSAQQGEEAETRARARQSAPRPARRAARRDGTGGNPILVGVGEDHVLVPVVLLRGGADLCPLPAQERHRVRIGGIAADLVALADRLHGLPPVARGDSLGVVVDGPEVECRAVAGEVTGVRRRVRPFALGDRQADQEGVEGEGGVDVEVAEEDLLRLRDVRRLRRRRAGRLHRSPPPPAICASPSPRRAPRDFRTTRARRPAPPARVRSRDLPERRSRV